MPADPPLAIRVLLKLVRDRVGDFLPDSTVSYEPITDEAQAINALRGKLVEEALEYLLNPSIGELADVLEVVDALWRHDRALGRTGAPAKVDILREKAARRKERGGFDGLVGMYVTSVAGQRHEGERHV